MSKNYGDKIMKKLVISVLLAVLFILSAGVVNAEEKRAGEKKLGSTKVLDPEKMLGRERLPVRQTDRQSRRGTTGFKDRLQRIDKGIKVRLGEHKKFIDELISIRKLAIEEKAEKTARRIEAMIEAKNAEFAESVKKLSESRNRFREGLVRPGPRRSTVRQRAAGPTEVTTPQPKQENEEEAKEEKEDKGRWWQFWK